jgi:hypothetical protein
MEMELTKVKITTNVEKILPAHFRAEQQTNRSHRKDGWDWFADLHVEQNGEF